MLGEPIVVYRTASAAGAKLVALADRCCHRGAPLSKGRLEGDNLRCGYHGLLFNPAGQCIEVPGMDSAPLVIPLGPVEVDLTADSATLSWTAENGAAGLTAIPLTQFNDYVKQKRILLSS